LETQAALVWLSALIADKEIHKRGLVNLGDVVGVFDRLRTVLTKVSEESVFYSWEARRDRSRSNGNHPEVDNQEGELLSERTSS
jgi:hypothetical protein